MTRPPDGDTELVNRHVGCASGFPFDGVAGSAMADRRCSTASSAARSCRGDEAWAATGSRSPGPRRSGTSRPNRPSHAKVAPIIAAIDEDGEGIGVRTMEGAWVFDSGPRAGCRPAGAAGVKHAPRLKASASKVADGVDQRVESACAALRRRRRLGAGTAAPQAGHRRLQHGQAMPVPYRPEFVSAIEN